MSHVPWQEVALAALARYCKDSGLDPVVVFEYAEGRPIPWALALALERDLGVPVELWRDIIGRPAGRPRKRLRRLVALNGNVIQRWREGVQEGNPFVMTTAAEVARRIEWGKASRRFTTKVHAVLDELGLTVIALTDKVNAWLAMNDPKARAISRTSMQHYSNGERVVGSFTFKGRGKHKRKVWSYVRAGSAAPLYIRRAAQAVTNGKLSLKDWPNVEDEDA